MLSTDARDILAFCTLVALAAAFAGWIVLILRRSPFTVVQSTLYGLNYLITRILWRATVHGRFPIATDRGAVIACNHRCPLDPSFVAMLVPRAVHWMVAREYCEIPGLRQLLAICEVIPVRRGTVDMRAVKEAIRLARQGELVGVFPEGRINTTAQLLGPGHSGAALIALKARVPVVPCYVHGAPYDGTTLGCLLMPAAVRLVIGPPIHLSAYFGREKDRDVLAEVTRRVMTEIARLAGEPDFQPQLARRRSPGDPTVVA